MRIFIWPVMIAGLVLAGAHTAEALDKSASQVLVESKIIYVTQKDRDLGIDMTAQLSPLPDGKVRWDVSAVATGKGVMYRKWIPERLDLLSGSEVISSGMEETKIYIPKPSVAAPVAPLLFAAIGVNYDRNAQKAAENPGTSCSASSHSESTSGEQNAFSKSIDKAGMSAGLGLLTAQAKGEIEGRRYTFITDTPLLKSLIFKTKIRNIENHKIIILIVPITVDDLDEVY